MEQQPAIIHDSLGDHGELRVYRRPGPPEHAAFEVLRASDGRAWTLRVPWTGLSAVRRLLGETAERLGGAACGEDDDGEPPRIEVDQPDCAGLARAELGAGDELVAVVLSRGEERALALWRRERTRHGWGWTPDVVVVPAEIAVRLCERMLVGLQRLSQPPARPAVPAGAAAETRASGPILPTPSQPPSAMTLSISRR